VSDLDDLLRASLAATTPGERKDIGGKLAEFPDIVAELETRLRSPVWDTRRLALHFMSRLGPPPEELTAAFTSALQAPLSQEPFGEETVLGLVIAGVIAARVTRQRALIAQRLAWIERAIAIGSSEVADHPGEPTSFDQRAAIALRLARETLAKIDAAIAAEQATHEALIATIAAELSTSVPQATTLVILYATQQSGDRDAVIAGLWHQIARRFAPTAPEHRVALTKELAALRAYASTSTAGGEGMARMVEVHELERVIAGLP